MSCGKIKPVDMCYLMMFINIMVGLIGIAGGVVLMVHNPIGLNVVFFIGGVTLLTSGVMLGIGVRRKNKQLIITSIVLSLLGFTLLSICISIEIQKPHIFVFNIILLGLHVSVYNYSQQLNGENSTATNATDLTVNNDQNQDEAFPKDREV